MADFAAAHSHSHAHAHGGDAAAHSHEHEHEHEHECVRMQRALLHFSQRALLQNGGPANARLIRHAEDGGGHEHASPKTASNRIGPLLVCAARLAARRVRRHLHEHVDSMHVDVSRLVLHSEEAAARAKEPFVAPADRLIVPVRPFSFPFRSSRFMAREPLHGASVNQLDRHRECAVGASDVFAGGLGRLEEPIEKPIPIGRRV
jgi:hypothetical protein